MTSPGTEVPIGKATEGKSEASRRGSAEGRPGDFDALSDAALVVRVRADSADALAALYRRHGRMVYHVAYRFLASEPDAEDVVQDVFAGLPEALRRYEERDRFPYWLKRTAVRAALMMLRARDRRREEVLAPDVSSRSGPSADVVIDYLAMRHAIRQLSDEQRAVLMLKQVEGYSHAEIAQLLGISENASAVRLHRALRRLWDLMGGAKGGGA